MANKNVWLVLDDSSGTISNETMQIAIKSLKEINIFHE